MRKPLGHFALLLLLAGCGGSRVAKMNAAAKVIEGSADFKAAKLVYVPRQIAIPAEARDSSAAQGRGEASVLTCFTSRPKRATHAWTSHKRNVPRDG